MITKEQALTLNEFHEACSIAFGPKGGVYHRPQVWRRNGQTKTWKTRPSEFRVPVKFGMREFAYITQDNAELVVAPEDCMACTDPRISS